MPKSQYCIDPRRTNPAVHQILNEKRQEHVDSQAKQGRWPATSYHIPDTKSITDTKLQHPPTAYLWVPTLQPMCQAHFITEPWNQGSLNAGLFSKAYWELERKGGALPSHSAYPVATMKQMPTQRASSLPNGPPYI